MIGLYIVSFIFLVSVLRAALKRSEFGVLIAISELPFYIGMCLYPIFFEKNLLLLGTVEQSYVNVNGEPGWMTAIHIFLYSAFAALGYSFSNRLFFLRPNIFIRKITQIAKPNNIWRLLILTGIITYVIFFMFIGIDTALINAIYARSGNFDGFGDNVKFLFLKTFAGLSGYAACFVPYAILFRRDYFFLFLYIIVVILSYLNSISRSLLLSQIIIPLLVVLYNGKGNVKNLSVFAILIAPLSLIVLLYGKSFGHFLSSLMSGEGTIEIGIYQGGDGFINTLFRNYSFIWFSMDAGWLSFMKSGSILPADSFMAAIIGFVPSRALEYLDLGWLYYGNMENMMACVNTYQFGINGCTIPPLFTGVSIYIAPIIGPAIFGFLKYFAYGRMEKIWMYYKNSDYSMTWVPYFLFVLFASFTSFIPSAIAPASFMALLTGAILIIQSIGGWKRSV